MDDLDMRIAQLSVAGEEQTRPNFSNPPGDDADQQALDEYACDRSNLPWVIFRAAHRANHVAALPARARALLAALARTVDAARPYAAIFARRELLTGRALQSMRTFYRSLDDLETAGLITRPPQTRYGSAGLFGRAYLHLTAKATVLLGLVEPSASALSATDAVANVPESATSTSTALSLAGPSVTLADGAIYKDLFPTTQKRQPGRLPADLERLRALGFREFLIFRLMREARQHAKRLSDVVEATWEHLRRATHPISYLRTLLRAPVDFAYRVRVVRQTVVEQTAEHERVAQAQSAADDLAGKVFVSHDDLRTYHVSGDAQSVTIQHRDEPRPRVHAGRWITDFVAALHSGHIVPFEPASARADDPKTAPARDITAPSKARLDDLRQFLRRKQAESIGTIRMQRIPMIPDRPTEARSDVCSMTLSALRTMVQNE
jgi:hypothetical protein